MPCVNNKLFSDPLFETRTARDQVKKRRRCGKLEKKKRCGLLRMRAQPVPDDPLPASLESKKLEKERKCSVQL